MKAAPAHFPYAHRTLAQVDYDEWSRRPRSRKHITLDQWIGEQIRNETFAEPAVCDKESSGPESVCRARPAPDRSERNLRNGS